MLKIRFTRTGRKHDPNFRIVVVDSRKSVRSSSFLENLGFRNPKTKKTELKEERVKYWISKGAQLSDSVHNLLISKKIIEGKKRNATAKSKKKPEIKESEVDKK